MVEPARIKVETPTPAVAAEMKAYPTWSCGVGVFDWHYEQAEVCLLTAGQVRVTVHGGETVSFAAGDLVTFPRGIQCTWDVRAPVCKHFRFE